VKQITFGSYTLLRKIARGGMAELFLARRSGEEDRPVVIKLVSRAFAKDRSFATMFEDEGRIVALLDHPNIGRVFEMGHAASHCFIAMEYIHGKDLRKIVRRHLERGSPVPPSIAAMIGIQICEALDYAHQARGSDGTPLRIVHRDVSPSNIMVTFEGQVKLVDFGIAKATGRSALTQPGTIKGKVRYLSPEQILGKELDGRSDIFTLGTSLWEATVGGHLFSGSRPADYYKAIAREPIRRPSAFVPDYPGVLEQILLKALCQDRDGRYAEAREIQRDLAAFADSAGLPPADGVAALTRFMRDLHGDEVEAWERARARGTSLLEHLLSTADPADNAFDLDGVLSGDDEQRTTIEPASSPFDDDGRSKTLVGHDTASTKVAGDELSEEPPRKTILYCGGPLKAPASRDTPAPKEADPATISSGESRPALDDLRPTIIDDMSDKFLAEHQQASSPAEPETDPSRRPPSRTAHAVPPEEIFGDAVDAPRDHPEPIIAKSAKELAAKQQEAKRERIRGQGREQPPTKMRRKRPRTGDWAHQAMSEEGEERAGTHPFFKELGEAGLDMPRVTGARRPPGARRALLALLIAVIGAAIVVIATWLVVHLRADEDPGRPVTAGKAHEVRIESRPSGATVFSAADGRELGRTPLVLEIGEPRKVELRLQGHEIQSVVLRPSSRHEIVELKPEISK
jgi:serine/threonine-protein kinase